MTRPNWLRALGEALLIVAAVFWLVDTSPLGPWQRFFFGTVIGYFAGHLTARAAIRRARRLDDNPP